MKMKSAQRLSWVPLHGLPRWLPACALALCSMAAQAQTNSVNISVTGSIKTGTCNFTIANINLGTFQVNDFTGVGYTTNWVPTTVMRSNCDPAITDVHMQFNGTPDTSNPAYFAAVSTDGLSGLAIALGDANNASVAPNATVDWDVTNGATGYTVNAQFVQTMAAVATGQTTTPITVQFTYN